MLCLPSECRSWLASAISPASCGDEALVPPMMCHPTRTPGKLVYTRTPPSTAAFQERSGKPLAPWRVLDDMPLWKLGVLNRALLPPPVAAGRNGSFQTTSVRLPGVVV